MTFTPDTEGPHADPRKVHPDYWIKYMDHTHSAAIAAAIDAPTPSTRPALIYVAGPFTPLPSQGKAKTVRLNRYLAHLDYACDLVRAGLCVYSPVVLGYHLAFAAGLSDDHPYWHQMATLMVPICTELHVLRLDGWEQSRGLAYEIDLAQRHHINIKHVTP